MFDGRTMLSPLSYCILHGANWRLRGLVKSGRVIMSLVCSAHRRTRDLTTDSGPSVRPTAYC